MGDESDRTPRVESDEDLINVQTLHSSKGLEYPVVYLVGAAKPPKATKSAVFHVHDAGIPSLGVADVFHGRKKG